MHRPTSRRVGLAVTSAAMLAASIFPAKAGASAADQPPSTPVPVVTPDGMLMSYVVNANEAGPAETHAAERAVKAAGGVVVQSWPQIGVVIAHSTRAAFRDEVRKARGVESVGASRTAAVKEGTPETVPAPPGPAVKPGPAQQSRTSEQPQLRGFSAGDVSAAAPAQDPRESEQWNNRIIKADKAHEITDGSRKVVVGVLDSGIESTHPDLAPNIDAANSVSCIDAGTPDKTPGSWEPTTSGHGTHVAGTIAAARNGVGIVGVAPNVKLASVKVVSDDGFIYPEYAICGFIWAAEHGMDVTNNSYYVDPWEFWCGDQPDQAAGLEAVRRAVAFSEKKGVVSAAAAGNSAYDLANKTTNNSSPNDTTPVPRTINNGCKDIPTELPGVVTTSSIDINSNLSSFSNIGLGVIDVAAPGSRVLSTYPNGSYALLSGTSMASPHAAGVLALLKSTHPKAKPAQLVQMLRAQADDHACPTDTARCTGGTPNNSYYGEGITDALDAVGQAGPGGPGPR